MGKGALTRIPHGRQEVVRGPFISPLPGGLLLAKWNTLTVVVQCTAQSVDR